jgi:hypothetical protein
MDVNETGSHGHAGTVHDVHCLIRLEMTDTRDAVATHRDIQLLATIARTII